MVDQRTAAPTDAGFADTTVSNTASSARWRSADLTSSLPDRSLHGELVNLKNAHAGTREVHTAEHIDAYAAAAEKSEMEIASVGIAPRSVLISPPTTRDIHYRGLTPLGGGARTACERRDDCQRQHVQNERDHADVQVFQRVGQEWKQPCNSAFCQ